MKRSVKILLVVFGLLLTLDAGVVLGIVAMRQTAGNGGQVVPALMGGRKLNEVWSLIERNYVDPVDADSVMDKMLSTMLSSLDPHSVYLSAVEMKRENEELQGYFEGVGLTFRMRNDTVCVQEIIPGGPSDGTGLMAGDRILAVGDYALSGVKRSSDTVVAHLRGPKRSTAVLTVKRYGEKGTRTVSVKRGIVHTNSVAYSGLVDSRTGYLRLTQFTDASYTEFANALLSLKRQGIERLIVDLRGNGGGSLGSCVGICNELLPAERLIVYTEGLHNRREEIYSDGDGMFDKGELVVLIDEYSASASEIVAGAVQDNDRGLVVGRRTFGKGLVQQIFPLRDGSSMLLTIARYYTPSGRCIQRPYERGIDEYYNDFIEQVREEYLEDSTLMKINDSTEYHTVGGRVVYGGGGIYPDHYVRYQSDTLVGYYNALISKGVIDDYAFNIVSREARDLKRRFPTVEQFVRGYSVSQAMMEQLTQRAADAGVKREAEGLAKYYDEIRSYLKATIAESLYSEGAFYAVHLKYDPHIQAVMEIMNAKQ